MKSVINWLFFVFSISLVVFIVAVLSYILLTDYNFSTNNIKDLLGIIISCVALIVTAFFVIMAINAFAHIKGIEEVRNKADESINKIKEVSNDYESLKSNIANIKKDLQLEIYRGVYYRQLTDETKKSYLLSIAILGDASDIEHLDKIINSKKESHEVKSIASVAKKQIEDRTSKESSQANIISNSSNNGIKKCNLFFRITKWLRCFL